MEVTIFDFPQTLQKRWPYLVTRNYPGGEGGQNFQKRLKMTKIRITQIAITFFIYEAIFKILTLF